MWAGNLSRTFIEIWVEIFLPTLYIVGYAVNSRFQRTLDTGPVRPLGKLGSRLGPPIFRGHQFCKTTSKKLFLEIHK